MTSETKPTVEQVTQELISKVELHVEPIGWIRISWEIPVSREHADAALLEAISPSARNDALEEAGNAWRPISEAEYNTPVEVKVGHMTFQAMLVRDAAMATMDEPCDQWQATIEGEHPPCWSGGACWEVNEDEVASLAPTHFRALKSQPAAGGAGMEERKRIVE